MFKELIKTILFLLLGHLIIEIKQSIQKQLINITYDIIGLNLAIFMGYIYVVTCIFVYEDYRHYKILTQLDPNLWRERLFQTIIIYLAVIFVGIFIPIFLTVGIFNISRNIEELLGFIVGCNFGICTIVIAFIF